jgi:hypothetical protein
MGDLSFRRLEVFAQIMECGSFRVAAERPDISQVSVYRGAKKLLQGRAELLEAYPARSSAGTRSKLRIAAHGYIADRFSRRLECLAQHHG